MDSKTIYDKAEKAINQAFETAKVSVKVLSEKAGEAAHVTKLLIEKASLEHRVSRKFAELGNRIYQKALKEGKSVDLEDAEVKTIVDQTRKLDEELSQVEATIERERKEKQAKKA